MNPILPDELELLRQLIAGDAESFRKIYENYHGKIYLFALRLTKSKSEAEEIVQEVFVRLWEKRENIKIEKKFTAYILAITKNFILDNVHLSEKYKNRIRRLYISPEEVMELIKKNKVEEEPEILELQD